MNTHKKKALISIRKTKSLLEKIENMIGQDTYCGDIIIQNMAAIGLIKSANNKLIEAFLENCDTHKTPEEKKAEIVKLFQLSHK
ncbi:MAG: metal-sensitive transcriptional regulator [Candidatus Gracilibacteria bacterium]|nr:metal-sensitive transcriptional regulator [Candidatus Gracilibacteria bacterium]